MNLTKAVEILHKFFMISHDVFYQGVDKEELIKWAEQIQQPNYKLTWNQHNFLIGRGW